VDEPRPKIRQALRRRDPGGRDIALQKTIQPMPGPRSRREFLVRREVYSAYRRIKFLSSSFQILRRHRDHARCALSSRCVPIVNQSGSHLRNLHSSTTSGRNGLILPSRPLIQRQHFCLMAVGSSAAEVLPDRFASRRIASALPPLGTEYDRHETRLPSCR
jgi:hypothetical protein